MDVRPQCPYNVSYPRQNGDTRQERGSLEVTSTPEQRLGHADQQLQDLKDTFVEAIDQLQRAPSIDGSFSDRLSSIDTRLRELRHALFLEDLDKVQINEFHSALWEIKDLIDDQDDDGDLNLDVAEQLLVCIERVRHVIRDALDEHVAGVPTDAGLVVAQLKEWLPNTSNDTIARLVGVRNRRTLYRWTKTARPASRRLQLVARLVAVLRHNWTEEGIVAWFDRPRRDLDGRKPFALLDDPQADEVLLMQARSGRSQYAS